MLRQQLNEIYLDFVNNYLTRQFYADHHNITLEQATTLLDLGREIHLSIHSGE